jgi:hypothetical protein
MGDANKDGVVSIYDLSILAGEWGQTVTSLPNTVTNDTTNGKIYVENSIVKMQFNYKALSTDFSNRSGGAIYGLWDKSTSSSNLVQAFDFNCSGCSPSRAGIGGLGTTKTYVNPGTPTSSNAISENGKNGKLLVGPEISNTSSGTSVRFIYQVSDQNSIAHYTIDKTWFVRPNGSIQLTGHWVWLRPGEQVNDPNWNFAVSRDYVFSQVRWLTHEWNTPPCLGNGSDGLANPNAWRTSGLGIGLSNPDPATVPSDPDMTRIDIGTKHVQEYEFDAPNLELHIGWGAGGYESSGLFATGYNSWYPTKGVQATGQITGELSSYNLLPDAYGHTTRFGSWFSSDGSDARFTTLVGNEWTDVFEIKISH